MIVPDTFYEVNLFRRPICFLDKSKTGTDAIIDISFSTPVSQGRWRVYPVVEIGAAGPLEDAVLMAIFTIISQKPKPVTNPIVIGSLRQLCRVMGFKSDAMIPKVKNALERLASLHCVSEFAWLDKSSGRHLEGAGGRFNIFSVFFKDEDIGDGKRAETNLVLLNEVVLRNINARYICPIDSRLYFKLQKPTSRAFIKKFQTLFFASEGKPFVDIRYKNLCEDTTLDPMRYRSLAAQQCEPAFGELREFGFIEKFRFDDIAGIKNDWKITVWKGPKWNYEKQKITRSKRMPTWDRPLLPGIAESVSEIEQGKIPIPGDFAISGRVREWAAEKSYDRLEEHLEAFKFKVAKHGYQYVDWDSAFMEAVREDWAKLRNGKNGNGSGDQARARNNNADDIRARAQLLESYNREIAAKVTEAKKNLTPSELSSYEARAKEIVPKNQAVGERFYKLGVESEVEKLIQVDLKLPSFEEWRSQKRRNSSHE